MLDLEPLDKSFGAVVAGVELRSIDDDTFAALHAAWLDYGLLIFPEQFLTTDEQNDFAKRFGDLEFAATPISNLSKNGDVHHRPDDDVVKSLRGNEGWHHDSTYMPVQAKGAVFSAEIIPTDGGATGFADMRAAYEELDDATKALIADLKAHHSLHYSNGRMGYLPAKNEEGKYTGPGSYGLHDLDYPIRPLVKVHPETGRPNLMAGRHAHDIPGMDPAESEAFLDELNARAVSNPDHVHHHHWTVGDAVIWDNRRLMHQGTPFDMTQPRRMWHTRIAGEAATETADNYR